MKEIRILILEDDLIIAAHISNVIQDAGYLVSETLTKGESALTYLREKSVDLVIMDIQLAGDLDGIETAKLINQKYNVPIIFLTGNSDQATFSKSKEAFPHGFISKPFKNDDLIRNVELILNQRRFDPSTVNQETKDLTPLTDRIFVRDKSKLVKLKIADILYVEAERNYCKITTNQKSYTLSIPLLTFEKKLSSSSFLRIHRSHLVNITAIDELDDHYVFINGKALGISKSYKQNLSKKLNMV